MVDDLRPELGVYGGLAKTPNMDALASTGIVFDRAFTSQAVCAPSRIAFFSALRPDTTGITTLDVKLDQGVPGARTLPDVFRAAGYQTISFGKTYHAPDDDSDGFTKRVLPENYAWYKRNPGQIPPIVQRWDPRSELDDDINVEKAKAELARLGTSRVPFMMAVGINRPHVPWIVPSQFFDMYSASSVGTPFNPRGQIGAPPWAVLTYELSSFSELKPQLPDLSDETTALLRWGYMASVSYADDLVGQLLGQLSASGLDHNTIVVLWGDHGFKLGDHNRWSKHSNADVDIRTPLIVRVPGITAAGTRTSAIVEAVDIFPTLAELTDLTVPSASEGLSFRPLFHDPARPWKSAAFAQYPRASTYYGDLMGYTVRNENYRYTAWLQGKDKVVARELYDLSADPEESTNIANDPRKVADVQRMEDIRIAGWKAVRDRVP